jgi:ribonuclease R
MKRERKETRKKRNKNGSRAFHHISVSGRLAKTQKGFGFVVPDDKTLTLGKDVFIAPAVMGQGMNGDHVEVEVSAYSLMEGNPEGRIVRVIKRNVYQVIGTFKMDGDIGFVAPENKRNGEQLLVYRHNFNGAKQGDKVVAKVIRRPDGRTKAEGKITEIIGRRGEERVREKALIRAYGMSESFHKGVLLEALQIPEIVGEKDLENRKDLRGERIITMDGADAKDLDDGVSIKILDNGNYQLGVHIADVSHYVKEGTALDEEALRRGCSVYLIDIVLPMLPGRLSNGVCSLNQGVDRLTLSVSMEIDLQGSVVGYEIFESVIRSMERMTYTDVSDILEKNCQEQRYRELINRYDNIYEDLLHMDRLARILKEKRQRRGSLNFDFDEPYIGLDEDGKPLWVEASERRTANGIIEEFMLVANETVAQHHQGIGIPFVYRIHEKPAPDKMLEFQRIVHRFGINLTKGHEVTSRELNEVLSQAKNQDWEHLVNTLLLRSMKKAAYNTECKGHFGLGTDYYCHFTSPIRRYPDLIIHRIIKEKMKGNINRDRLRILESKTSLAADLSSAAERVAEELEREMDNLKIAEYMLDHLGEEYDGVISGLSQSGIFVEISGVIEGRVPLESLDDDYYYYDEDNYRYMGRRNHRIYGLGGKVRIRVMSANPDSREVCFEIIQ